MISVPFTESDPGLTVACGAPGTCSTIVIVEERRLDASKTTLEASIAKFSGEGRKMVAAGWVGFYVDDTIQPMGPREGECRGHPGSRVAGGESVMRRLLGTAALCLVCSVALAPRARAADAPAAPT